MLALMHLEGKNFMLYHLLAISETKINGKSNAGKLQVLDG